MKKLLLSALFALSLSAQDGFVPLFNGKNLDGWANVNCAPGTFTVRDGMIISTGIPTGVLRTDRQYENFELELEYKHIKAGGNAGLFIWSDPVTSKGVPFTRSIEVQILDGHETEGYTSHGDIFSIHGATMKPDRPHPGGWMRCLPSEKRAKSAGEWNHYRLWCTNGVIKLAVNGKVVSGASECNPRKGYLCLESEGSETHFKNIRIRELPSTTVPKEFTAAQADGFQSIYTGVDLTGWQKPQGGTWKAEDWTLTAQGDGALSTERKFEEVEFICDVHRDTEAAQAWIILGEVGVIPLSGTEPAAWVRVTGTLRAGKLSAAIDGKSVVKDLPAQPGPLALKCQGGRVQFANIYIKPPGR